MLTVPADRLTERYRRFSLLISFTLSLFQNMISEYQIVAVIEQLERKIGLLRGVCDDANREVKRLELQNSVLNERLLEQQQQRKELEKKQADSDKKTAKSKHLSKLVQNNLSETDTNTALKKQLDAYIQELNRCIAHLSSLS